MPLMLAQLPSQQKIPIAEVNRRSRVVGWGNNIKGNGGFGLWSRSFTVPDEGGSMRCLFASWAASYVGAVGYHYFPIYVDNTLRAYHRAYFNFAGHRPMVNSAFMLDLAPGAHTIDIRAGTGSNAPDLNDGWSFFVLATGPVPGSRLGGTGPGAARLAEIPSTRNVRLGDTDLPLGPGIARLGRYQGGWTNGARLTSAGVIPLDRPVNVLFVFCMQAYNNTVNVGTNNHIYLNDGTTQFFAGETLMAFNDGPVHRTYVPVVWYGEMQPGQWYPVIYQGNYVSSNGDDWASGFAIVGV